MLVLQFVGYTLLVPFFGWGIYLLRRRFLYYEESTMTLEIVTSVAVGLFFWIETMILREALTGQFLLYLASMLGLSMAGFALYAHVVISLASRLIVDMVAPGDDSALDHPRFGPVEVLERNGDYEGALSEYLILARIYPRNVEVLCRTANAHVMLDRPQAAVEWYIRARKRAKRADDALEAVNQLCRLYDNEFAEPEKADYQLARFIQDFPDAPDVSIVRDRLNRRAQKNDWSISDFLNALEDDPLSDSGTSPAPLPEVGPPLTLTKPAVELVALHVAGAADVDAPVQCDDLPLQDSPQPTTAREALMPMSDSRFDIPVDSNDVPRDKRSNGTRKKTSSIRNKSGLEKLDRLDSATTPQPSPPADRISQSGIVLEPMDDKPA